MSRQGANRYPQNVGDRYAARPDLPPPRPPPPQSPYTSTNPPTGPRAYPTHPSRAESGTPPRPRDVTDPRGDRYAAQPAVDSAVSAASAYDKSRFAEPSAGPSARRFEERDPRDERGRVGGSAVDHRAQTQFAPTQPPLDRRMAYADRDRYKDLDSPVSQGASPAFQRRPAPPSTPGRPSPAASTSAPTGPAGGVLNTRDVPGDKISRELKEANRRESWVRKPAPEVAAPPSAPQGFVLSRLSFCI